MSSRFVRQSKYRHVFTPPVKPDGWYNGVRVSKTAWEGSDYVAANRKFFGMLWGSAGGGAVAVISHSAVGKLPEGDKLPIINGHKNPVLDLAFNPFNDNILVTGSEDCYAKLWKIPENGLETSLTADDAAQQLKGHKRKVGTVNWNPVAANVLATSSQDYTVKLWDVTKGEVKVTLDGPKDLIQSVNWNDTGSLLVIASKDKQVRFSDPRTNAWEGQWQGHEGSKGMRALFLDDGKVFTTGFDKTSGRQYRLWDPRGDTSKPLVTANLDVSSGVLMPHYDADTKMIYIAGRGDGNIRFYEYESADSKIFPLSEHKGQPYKGGAFVPKTACDVNSCEVAKFFALCEPKSAVIPISFVVPRKSDMFQDDIFPDTISGVGVPALDQDAWFGGANGELKPVSLEEGYVAPPPKEVVIEKVVEKELTPQEMKNKLDELQKRVDHLETQLHLKDLKIKELEGK